MKYQFCEGDTEMGVGTADVVARSTKVGLEADTSKMDRESQRSQQRALVCMLSRLRRSAYGKTVKERSAVRFRGQVVKGK